MYEAILKEIKAFDTVIIHRHNKPDGDAIGSQIGLKHIIQTNYPGKKVYAVGDEPGFYGFMEDSQPDEIPDSTYENALAIILDCGAPALISDSRYKLAKRTARIDHHIFGGKIADTEVIDTSYESCCGMIAHLAKDCGLQLNCVAAKSLYTGMVTDSGRFRYDATTARTHELAAFLMGYHFDTNEIYRELYADTYESKKLKAQFLLKVQFTPNNVAYIYTTRDELAQLDTDIFTISRGMVNTMADMKGVNCWANFTETDNGVLCELRSSLLSINHIAVKYGGGGHAKACGATVANRETVVAMLEDLDRLIGGNT